jgi:hypothetical protein
MRTESNQEYNQQETNNCKARQIPILGKDESPDGRNQASRVRTSQITSCTDTATGNKMFVAKKLGIFGFCWLAIKCKLAELPKDSTWLQFYGVAVWCWVYHEFVYCLSGFS